MSGPGHAHPDRRGLEESVALTVLEHSADAFLVVDESGCVVYANPAAGALFGRELSGSEFGHPIASDAACEMELVASDGKPVVAEMRGGGSVWKGRPAWVISLRDVTDRRRAEEELRESARELGRVNAELERSNRDLQDFAHAISHDLREPLRGLGLHCGWLAERAAELDDEGRERLERVLRLARRMDERIHALLHFSRVGREKVEGRATDLDGLVDDACETLSGLVAGMAVELRVGRPLPRVLCDPALVLQVLENLITNALKYNDSVPKRVEITATVAEAPGGGAARRVRVEVCDNGIGVPERQREAVFSMFRRLHEEQAYGGGNGVGLAVARRIVEGHGGAIWVEGAPAGGSRFCFTLPAAE